jgi:hypothetical protein
MNTRGLYIGISEWETTSIVSIHCKVQLSCGGKRQQHAQDRAVAITVHRNVMTCPFHIIVCTKVYLGMKK